MQQALQNPHYKKIWEKVIMGRHFEAKSFKEALEMEACSDGCLFYNDKNKMYGFNVSVETLTRSNAYKYEIQKYLSEPFLWQNLSSDEIDNWQYAQNFQILGRPITLEDVMILLPKDFAFWNLYSSIVKINIRNSFQPVTGYNIDWKLTKFLHQQTPETWEKIANLIY